MAAELGSWRPHVSPPSCLCSPEGQPEATARTQACPVLRCVPQWPPHLSPKQLVSLCASTAVSSCRWNMIPKRNSEKKAVAVTVCRTRLLPWVLSTGPESLTVNPNQSLHPTLLGSWKGSNGPYCPPSYGVPPGTRSGRGRGTRGPAGRREGNCPVSERRLLTPAALPRLSFYSGHSSFGMYCMTFLAVSLFHSLCYGASVSL